MDILFLGTTFINREFLDKFDITKNDDVKTLCNLSLTCIDFYRLVKPYIKHLISFFRYRHEFKLLGHYESILSNDLRIIKYLEKKYYPVLFYKYLSSNEISNFCEKGFFIAMEYILYKNILPIDNCSDYLKYLFIGTFLSSNYNKFIEYIDFYGFDLINRKIDYFRYLWLSDNEKILDYHFKNNKLYISGDNIDDCIKNNKYTSLRYIILNFHKLHKKGFMYTNKIYDFIKSRLTISYSLEMFKFIFPMKQRSLHDCECIIRFSLSNNDPRIFEFAIKKYINHKSLQELLIILKQYIPSTSIYINIEKINALQKIGFNNDEILFIMNNVDTIRYMDIESLDFLYNNLKLEFINNLFTIGFSKRNKYPFIIDYCLKKNPDLKNKINLDSFNNLNCLDFLKIFQKYNIKVDNIINSLLSKYKKIGYF